MLNKAKTNKATIDPDKRNGLDTIEDNLSQRHPNVKVGEIKIKQDDEWAKLANHNYKKNQKELQRTKIKEEEKKKIMRENLARQILEKQSVHVKEKENENNFLKQHQEILNKFDNNEKRKIEEMQNKIKMEKDMRDKIVQEARQVKKKVDEVEEKEDIKFLEKVRKDLFTDEEKLSRKKDEERQMYKQLIKENEERLKLKRIEKDQEKKENLKAIENYAKLIEKQDQAREEQKNNRLERVKLFMDKFGESVKVDEQLMKLREDKRFLREIEEKEKRDIEKEKTSKRQTENVKYPNEKCFRSTNE